MKVIEEIGKIFTLQNQSKQRKTMLNVFRKILFIYKSETKSEAACNWG